MKTAVAALVVAGLMLIGATGVAEPDPLAPWVIDARFDIARRLWSEHRIALVWEEDGKWSDAEMLALERGAAAVPRAIIDALDEPIRIRRMHRACLFGVGRDSKGCPTYDRDDNFLLYDLPPLQGEGPVQRLAPLDETERAEIQVRRAAVHAIMLAYDESTGWSDKKRWRQINGWRSRRQAMNRDRWGFSRYLGSHSPQADLVTFAEAWLVRPEDVIAAERRDAIDPNDSIECQEFTKSRFLAEQIALVDPAWHPPARAGAAPGARCPAFEEWARMADLEAIDVLVASATADRPESLYGHLLLHVRYDGRSEGFEPVYQFGAVTDTDVDPVTYFSRGLLGGFLSVLEVNSFRAVDRIFLQYEQRSLRRYELALSEKQQRRLMERLWEYERRYRYPYYFFANNCASFLIDLIGPALELDVPSRSHLVVAPTDVLDYLANIENPGHGTLLRKRPEMDFSSREIAQQSVRKRRKALDALLARIDDAATKQRLLELDEMLDDRAPTRRLEAYRQIDATLQKTLPGAQKEVVNRAIDYLYFASAIERYFAEVAFFRVRETRLNAVIDKQSFTSEELLKRRRELFETEDTNERYAKLLAWTEALEEKVVHGPHREFTDREEHDLEVARRTDETFAAALDTQASVIERFAPEFDGIAYLDARRDLFVREQTRRDALAVGPSGKGRLAVGGGAAVTSDASALVGGELTAAYSFIWERLGEQRRRGFRSDIETQSLGFELHVPTTERFWEGAALDFTLLRFITVEQKLGAVREGFFDFFGWGAELGADHDGRRGLDIGAKAAGGLILPVFQTDHNANHLILGLWGDARIGATDEGRRSLLGGDGFARLLLHLGGVYANSLRLEVGTRHWFGVETLSWEYEHRARISTEHATFWLGQYPLIVSPWVQAEWTSVDYADLTRDFKTARGGLTLELPL